MGRRLVDFRVLGPLEVYGSDGARVALCPRERELLAVLLVLAWTPVSRDTLTRALWGDRLPRHPGDALRLWFSRTRTALGPDGIRCLTAGNRAYRADPAPQDLDLARFWQLRTAADRLVQEREFRPASTVLQRALACWRDPALADLPDTSPAAAERDRLMEQRQLAELDLADVRLLLGEHHQIVPDLRARVVADPLCERAWAQFMRALYLCGRKNEALEAYGRAARVLRPPGGAGPGDELNEVLAAILRDEQHVLASPPPWPGAAAGTVIRVPTARGQLAGVT
jgi:DNA-binding SARP family transcriptional activator